MKKLNDILNRLGISKFTFYKTLIFNGFADLAKIIAEALTKLLQKADQAKLKEYSELASNIAKFVRYGVELFVKSEKYKDAGLKTADAIDQLAQHISDGTYDEDEVNKDFDNIKAAIDAWCDVK